MKVISFLLFFCFPHSLLADIITLGEWEMVYQDEESQRYYQKRKITWERDKKAVKSCYEYEWGKMNRWMKKSYSTHHQYETKCDFITFHKKIPELLP